MDRMAQRPTFATLLPTTAYFLKLTYPRAREMIKRKVPGICLLFLVSGLTGSVSLGSDFNPNAHCMSMPFVMNLACVNMGMTLEESLVTNFHSWFHVIFLRWPQPSILLRHLAFPISTVQLRSVSKLTLYVFPFWCFLFWKSACDWQSVLGAFDLWIGRSSYLCSL